MNPVKLYNTLTRKIEDFRSSDKQEIKLYSCGPTVYDYMHIGNLRKFTFDDCLRRTLIASGYNVKHVMNITDVGHLVSDSDEGEDKLEKGAKREGKSVWEVAKYYTEAFKKDVLHMNILPPNGYRDKADNYARATDFINQQIDMVKILLDKDFAYQTKEAIYFDVGKLPSYGELTGQQLSDKEVAVRSGVIKDKNKRSPQDFGLWFFTIGRFVNHDMRWPSPWGEGFPGWHLECSAIIHNILGDPIDIHTGGVDNIGTHHVNEMAQTEAAYGHKLARYWLHSEHLLVNGQRMSKSSGNYYTLKDVVAKGYSPLALRLLYLQTHYRSQMNFTWDSLNSAQANLKNIQDNFSWVYQSGIVNDKPVDSLHNSFKALQQKIIDSLSEDLNTPKALALINEYASGFATVNASQLDISIVEELDKFIFDTLGINILDKKRYDFNLEEKKLIIQRNIARSNKDWGKADLIKAKLKEQGLELLKDTPHGSIWRRG